MHGCKITDKGAQSIMECMKMNKTLLNFNIGNNPGVSHHLYRHILARFGLESKEAANSKTPSNKVSSRKLK